MNEPTPVSTKSALSEAIDLTRATFEERGRLYRNLVVAVSLVSLASILTAILSWRGLPLAGLILLLPLTGAFLYLDMRRVSRWRELILGMSRMRGLDLALFPKTVRLLKDLPQESLQSLLATLPAESSGPSTEEGPFAAGENARNDSQPDWKILATTAALTFAMAGVVAALHWRSPIPLLITGGSALFFTLSRKAKPS